MKTLTITEHGKQRIIERVGIKDKKKIKNHVSIVYKKGYKMYEIDYKLKRYIENKMKTYCRIFPVIRIVDKFIYIFSDRSSLITVIEIPENYRRNWKI